MICEHLVMWFGLESEKDFVHQELPNFRDGTEERYQGPIFHDTEDGCSKHFEGRKRKTYAGGGFATNWMRWVDGATVVFEG